MRDLINREDVIKCLQENGWLDDTNIDELIETYTPTEERGFGTKIADVFKESIENLGTNIQNLILFGVRHWIGNLLIIAAGVSCCLLIRKKKKKNEKNLDAPAKKESADEDCNLN